MEVKDLADEFFRKNPDLLEEGPYRQNDQNLAKSCLIEISDKSNSKSIRKKVRIVIQNFLMQKI